MRKSAIIFIIGFAICYGCKTKAPGVREQPTVPIAAIDNRECDSTIPKPGKFNIPIRILDNSLGYARVRCYPHFDANDTGNMIAKIKCGEVVMADYPDEHKYYSRPCCYAVMVKNTDGKSRVGFISCLVAKSLDDIKKDSLKAIEDKRKDSICDIEIQKLPEADRDGHIKQLVFKGVYIGKDLYIINPYNCRSGYCIISCRLNGNDVSGDKYYHEYGPAITVDDWEYIKIGDSVRLSISHTSFGTPKLLNPEALIKK